MEAFDKNAQKQTSKAFFVHPNFDNENSNGTPDIALIKLENPFTFDDKVNKIAIYPKNLNKVSDGKVSGFGYLEDKDEDDNEDLYCLDVEINTNLGCKNMLGPLENKKDITENKICAFKTVGKGLCSGDGGSGLEITEGKTRYLVGVVSYFIEGCASGYPDVYERVFSHIDWIKKTMGENMFV